MALTRRNVAYNLEESPFIYEVVSDDYCMKYVFSSEYNLNRFKERIYDHREKISDSLSNRFKISISFNILSDVKLYEAIEKRGFLIEYKGVRYRCLNNIRLDGNNLMKSNLEE